VKYIWFVMRADNHGEGGIFALLALIHASRQTRAPFGATQRGLGPAVIMILIGAALLYGDGIITPAISVLGAAEGFNAISPAFTPYVVPLACVILALLFWFQHKGTRNIGRVFGPVMLLWFVTLAVLGAWYLAQCPTVLRALNPSYALKLLHHPPAQVATLLGSIVLAITGAEALYADMGHFGRRYIALAWYGMTFPALILNYFGQGAFILLHPQAVENPFFAMAPAGFARYALTGLSIVAAVIASQALISGAYSLTRQAIQLGYFPRLQINHTNALHAGQIYVPFVNALLAIGAILTVIYFGSSTHLAAAYGIAVTGTMAITTVAYYLVARRNRGWSIWFAAPLCGVFLLIDLAFFFSNAHKLADGGWFPLAIGAVVLAVMHTWKSGKTEIFRRIYANEITEDELSNIACSDRIVRVRGTGVFMAGNPTGTPLVLLHHVKANKVLHETVVLLSVTTEEVPTVDDAERFTVRDIGQGVWRAVGRYGYMESPDVSTLMEKVRDAGVPLKLNEATYYFNREMIITGGDAKMFEWQKRFYSFLSRNARQVRDYYRLPPMQIIEVGMPIQL
jgi:KUP system potassium uptake protein